MKALFISIADLKAKSIIDGNTDAEGSTCAICNSDSTLAS